MAKIREAALRIMALERDPVQFSIAQVMIYLERYEITELEFNPIGK